MRIQFRHLRVALASLGIAAVAACGGDSPTGNNPPVQDGTVNATPQQQFDPPTVRILQGGTVKFVFGSLAHNVFFDNAPAGAPANITAPTTNTSMTLTFNTKGTYPYNCHIHPGMKGTVIVE